MRRLPILPSLIVAAAVAVMIGLGVWQLQRAAWKERLLGDLAAAPALPPVDLDRVLAEGSATVLAFRRATITCAAGDQRPMLRAGRNRQNVSGYSFFLLCRPGEAGLAGRIQINAGWSQALNNDLRLVPQGPVSGSIGTVEEGEPVILTADPPLAPLAPSAPPSIDAIPNNHLMYAGQWFFFALTALIIYALALRRRPAVAPAPPAP